MLIDDIDNVDELENDISYVYSGYAPISVRLVQCVAQKGGVLSNPALDKTNKPTEEESPDGSLDGGSGSTKVQAHPIVGWKGFEDVLASIPGETVDLVPKGLAPATVVNPGSIIRSACLEVHFPATPLRYLSLFKRTRQDYRGLLPWGLYVHRDCGHPVGC